MSELTLDQTLKRGNRGKKVKAVQEWLSLQGFGLVVDGDFGPAPAFAVRELSERPRAPRQWSGHARHIRRTDGTTPVGAWTTPCPADLRRDHGGIRAPAPAGRSPRAR